MLKFDQLEQFSPISNPSSDSEQSGDQLEGNRKYTYYLQITNWNKLGGNTFAL